MIAALKRFAMAAQDMPWLEPMGNHTKPGTLSIDTALAAVRRRGDEMHAMTRAWVEVNSYTENVAGVNAVGAMLREAFAIPGLTLEEKPGGRCGTHLFWRTAAAGAPILLVGHHDTVFPPGHFEGWRENGDGKAIGPGALDMKGGLAVIRAAPAARESQGVLAKLPLVVISVSDEEVGSPTSAPHLRELAKGAACALV